MNQDALFYEDLRGACRHLVGALGGPKKVGHLLRPTLSPKQAETWVNDCLNPDRVTKFDLEDIGALFAEGRKQGVHCALYQLCDEAGYARPEIAPTKTPDQRLAEDMQRVLDEFRRLADERAARERQSSVKAVR